MLFTIKANLVDLVARDIYPAEIAVEGGKILSVKKINEVCNTYLMPGFVDAHVHVESSMLAPSEFARIAVTHGSVATISDPHEIANVLGVAGVDYMIDNAKQVPFHFYFGAPSCVPATNFETAGAVIDSGDIDTLLSRKEIIYLAEMMNFPGVIYKDEEVLNKLASAKKHGKPIDGHAPGLTGDDMKNYFNAGITTDHECFGYMEALEKLKHGVNIMIREGSAAKNFDTLIPLLKEFPEQIMFCCDDKHPDNLIESHINEHVKRALEHGHNLFDVLRAASYNVIKHYKLPIGLLQAGDNADFIEVDNLKDFSVLKNYINGVLVAEKGTSLIKTGSAAVVNNFNCNPKIPADFKLKAKSNQIRVIEVLDGQLVTNELYTESFQVNGYAESNIQQDILKIAVVNRYSNQPVAIGFIKNTGLRSGAIASCVAHDCHNIVAVGTTDEDICKAVNLIIKAKGGISLANGNEELILELPIAGIMTNLPAEQVAEAYTRLDQRAKQLGSKLRAPYMSLSFMALLVIPELKLSDKGLFNGKRFEFTGVFVEENNNNMPLFNLQPTLENEFIKIVPLKAKDFETLYRIASDPLIWEQHPNKDRYKRDVFETFFKGAMESKGAFLVYDRQTEKPIGSSRYYDANYDNKSIAIGYTFLAKDHWGGVFNSALKSLMINHAFELFDSVILHIGANNIRSQKAAERIGAVKIDEQEIEYYGEASKLNFIYEIKKENRKL